MVRLKRGSDQPCDCCDSQIGHNTGPIQDFRPSPGVKFNPRTDP